MGRGRKKIYVVLMSAEEDNSSLGKFVPWVTWHLTCLRFVSWMKHQQDGRIKFPAVGLLSEFFERTCWSWTLLQMQLLKMLTNVFDHTTDQMKWDLQVRSSSSVNINWTEWTQEIKSTGIQEFSCIRGDPKITSKNNPRNKATNQRLESNHSFSTFPFTASPKLLLPVSFAPPSD